MTEPITIGGTQIKPGERKRFDLNIARLYDTTELGMPVSVFRGKKAGPTLFISAAIHGDELNGVEIVRRLIKNPKLKNLSGTLITVPIVNVFGFNNKARYLPDRRDLNRFFPGSKKGTLADRMANVFIKEIVEKSTHGIDLHTGAIHRTNLPQIRACLKSAETKRLAIAFGAPVVLDASLRDGSLRQELVERNIPILVYEGGEALRFDEIAIRSGLRGILSVMRSLNMIPSGPKKQLTPQKKKTFVALSSHWLRAPVSGILRCLKRLGDRVVKGEVLALIGDPFSETEVEVKARERGVIIGQVRMPLVNQGDGLFHVATFKNSKLVEERVDELDGYLDVGIS